MSRDSKRIQINILVVDDEKPITDLLERHLKYQGYNTTGVNDAAAAMKLIEDGNYHIVISDIVMPNMDGLELLRRIKKYDGGIKVIMITGFVTMHNILSAMRNGADDVIFKPLTDLRKIESAISEAIAKINKWQNILRELRDLAGDEESGD